MHQQASSLHKAGNGISCSLCSLEELHVIVLLICFDFHILLQLTATRFHYGAEQLLDTTHESIRSSLLRSMKNIQGLQQTINIGTGESVKSDRKQLEPDLLAGMECRCFRIVIEEMSLLKSLTQ